jgi:hypothetical protein
VQIGEGPAPPEGESPRIQPDALSLKRVLVRIAPASIRAQAHGNRIQRASLVFVSLDNAPCMAYYNSSASPLNMIL